MFYPDEWYCREVGDVGICGTVAINSVKDADIVMSTGEMQKEMLTVRLWLRRKISICLYGRIRTEVLKFRPELLFIPVLLPIFLLKMQMRGELRHGK